MIKFFRQIRQNMINNNRASKYLLYAIGEIILVVIGILIALQINNWNEGKKEQKQARVYIANLTDDLKKDLEMYDDQITAATAKYQYCKEIADILQNGKAIADTSAFIVHLQASGRLILPTLTDNTYRDLVSTGNLKIIKDQKIVDGIGEYYSNPLAWWYEDYKNQLVNGYLPLVVDAIPMHLHEEILNNEIVANYQDFTDKALLSNKVENFSPKDIDIIFSGLKNNEDFNFELKRITRSHLLHLKIIGLSKKSASNLLATLENWKTSND